MKLRNKKTGEIVVFGEGIVDLNQIGCKNVAEMIARGWEDYEEPKKHHYYIEPRGEVIELVFGDDVDELKEELSEIGNYFETQEEAEKAVEKLKAWKRLKDQGFSIDGYTNDIGDNYYMPSDFVIKLNYNGDHRKSYPDDVFKDLDLLFGGEE